jgi:hypothetical protein
MNIEVDLHELIGFSCHLFLRLRERALICFDAAQFLHPVLPCKWLAGDWLKET